MERLDVEVPRRADGPAVDDDHERDLVLGGERMIEPALEAEGVQVGEAVDLWLALSRFAKTVAVPFGDRLDAHDAPLERAGRSQLAHTTQYRGRGSFSRRRG